MRSKEVDFGKGSCAYNILLNLWRNQDDYTFRRRSRSVSEEEKKKKKKKNMEILGLDVYGTFTVL